VAFSGILNGGGGVKPHDPFSRKYTNDTRAETTFSPNCVEGNSIKTLRALLDSSG